MPGFVKVSGVQRPVAVPYVKVSGQWRPAALGYTKVDGQWRIWYTAEVKDNFNRSDSPTLSVASDGFSTWSQSSSAWSVANNAAQHNGGAGPDIATVPLYKVNTDVEAEADLLNGTGLGIAFWVVDNQNWWAAIPGRRVQNNPGFYSCPSGYTLEGTRCTRTVRYNATIFPPSTQTVYFCPAPYYDTGSGCAVQKFESNQVVARGIGCRGEGGCASAGGDCQYSQTCADRGLGPCNCVVYEDSCTCQPLGGSCGPSCSGTATTGYSSTTVSDPGGPECPDGGTIDYSTQPITCVRNDNIAATYNPPFDTYPSVVRLYRNVNGTISSQFESDVSSDPASFKIVVTGNNINIRLHSQALVQGNPYASRSFTATNPNRGTRVGIVKHLNQAQNQGTRLDNFRAK